MKKYTLILLVFISLSAKSQVVNRFRDSTWFAKSVRFDSAIYLIKGASNGKVLTSDAYGRATWQSASGGSGGGSQTLSISNDTLTISGGNSVILPVYIQIDSSTINSYDVLNSQNAPPGSPATGDIYLVGNSPSGAWVGHAKDIAEWDGADWVFTDGVQGDFLYNATTALTYIFRSGNWVQTTGIPALNNGNTISSGLRIGTNNARSLTFETNNANRGRFDSIGRFHVYNLPTSSTGDTFVTKSDASGKLTKVGQSTFLSSSSPALFPNGYVEVNESRDFNSGDANKLLGIKSDDITLSMPSINPFGEGDFVGIKNTNDYKNTHIILKEGSEPTLIGDEVFIFALVDIGGGIYVPQPLTGEIYDENEENEKSITRYLYDQSQNAIPLSGTEVGKPVTNRIEFLGDPSKTFASSTDELIIGAGNDLNIDENAVKKAYISFSTSNDINNTILFAQDGTNMLNASISATTDVNEADAYKSVITIIAPGNSAGLRGNLDFTANITDLDYTQKKYVDNAISSNRKVDTSYIFRNATLDSTCMITVINGITYRSCAKDSVGSGTAYTFSTGLTNTAGTVTANLSTGIAGGQSVIGGTASGNNLTLSSTSHATKGKILFGNSTYNELTNMLGIGTTSPTQTIEVTRNTSGADYPSILIKNTNTSGDSHSAIDLQVNNGAVWSQLLAAGTNTIFGAPGMGFRVITGHPFFIQTNNVTRLTVSAGGNVGIGTLTPVASAKLELSSTTQGFLPPRMTATQASAISTPAQGLLLFVSDTNGTFTSVGWWGYNGSTWEKLNN